VISCPSDYEFSIDEIIDVENKDVWFSVCNCRYISDVNHNEVLFHLITLLVKPRQTELLLANLMVLSSLTDNAIFLL
jgi:hypothetical protein